jgi:hypothetical protein
MLDRCRARAAERGVAVRVHHADMQSFELERRYRAIFIAGGSLTLLTTDHDAERTLERIHAHLVPGGSALIPLETLDATRLRGSIGQFKHVTTDVGETLRVGMVAVDASDDGHDVTIRLRYERIHASGQTDVVERDWRRRWWSQSRFREMMDAAGFEGIRVVAPGGGEVTADAEVFVVLARRPEL